MYIIHKLRSKYKTTLGQDENHNLGQYVLPIHRELLYVYFEINYTNVMYSTTFFK